MSSSQKMHGSSGKLVKSLVVILFVVHFIAISILGVAVLPHDGTIEATLERRGLKHSEGMERGKHVGPPELNPNYMSKRRVPNGPDPVHNRRSGDSKRPPRPSSG